MEYTILGWPPDGPKLRLDHELFRYAGKFVMTNTGKAAARADADEQLVAAVAFNEDRTDSGTLWLRYITVRDTHRGDGIGPQLAGFVAERADERGYGAVRIAVNNPFAYEAMYKAGFGYTGDETGVAELVLERPTHHTVEAYQDGLDVFRGRDLSSREESFLGERTDSEPPAMVRDSLSHREC